MKAIRYHYVRSPPTGLPFFRYLHAEDFGRQLDWLVSRWCFPSRDEFFEAAETGRAPAGVALTFDDGFRDHIEFVLPELQREAFRAYFTSRRACSVQTSC